MKIKGDTIKEGEAPLSGRLYKILSDKTIVFREKDTNDIVNINFCLRKGQYGIYGNEYKPSYAGDNGKKADILALVIDEGSCRFTSWIFDVKKTVGGEHVICHLVEQLIDSLKHKQSIVTYLEGYSEVEHIGYITHELQRDRIQATIDEKTEYLKKEKKNIKNLSALIRNVANYQLLKEEKKLNVITSFYNGYIETGGKKYKLEYYPMSEQSSGFVCNLDVACS